MSTTNSQETTRMDRCLPPLPGPGFVHLTSDRGSPIIGIDMASANALINEALCKFNNIQQQEQLKHKNNDIESYPDDTKLLANPKGIIKSYLAQAEATDPAKFDAYRKLCTAHIKEYFNHQKSVTSNNSANGGNVLSANTNNGCVCLVCNAVCQHWNTLQRHLQTHVDFRPFACDACGRTFFSQGKLKRHQIVHNDVKPYKCPMCERRLGRTEHLKRHLLVHTDSKPYGCSACTHTTKRLDGIRRHIKRKHGGSPGAEIVPLAGAHLEPESLENFRNAILNSVVSNPLQMNEQKPIIRPKNKKKKKKKVVNGLEYKINNDSCMIARDLRIPTSDVSIETSMQQNGDDTKDIKYTIPPGDERIETDIKHSISQSPAPSSAWDHGHLMLPTQLIYQSLARVHPASTNHPVQMHHQQVAHNNHQTPPKNFQTTSQSFVNNCLDAAARYSTNGSMSPPDRTLHHAPPGMLLPPAACSGASNISRYPHVMEAAAVGMTGIPAEMMITQYFQNHQRFAPPVWGFAANPSYPNY